MESLKPFLADLPLNGVGIFAGLALLGLLFFALPHGARPHPGIPKVSINPNRGWRALVLPDKMEYITHARQILEKGKAMTSGRGCFQVRAGAGWKIVVPNCFANEVRNSPDLSFVKNFSIDFHVQRYGFDGIKEGLRDDQLLQDTIRVKLTQVLNLVTEDVVDEANDSIHLWLGDSPEWKTHLMKDVLLDIIARLTSRVFVGKTMARNTEWLHIAKQKNTVTTSQGAADLHKWPRHVRPIAQWFVPNLAELRAQAKKARQLITPTREREEEQARRAAAIAAGEKVPKTMDSFSWLHDQAKGRPVDFAASQLFLSIASIHTSTELSTHGIMSLCSQPELVEPLREEILQALTEDGWEKTALFKMKLLDSFLKENQRFRQLSLTSMHRFAEKPVKLSDGTVIPQGALIVIPDDRASDASVYDHPEKFDAYRYMRMRERPGEENKHQLVTTSSENMGFGHGLHACPGRFFASNELKVLFCFLLLQYDFRFAPGYVCPQDAIFEGTLIAPTLVEVQVRRRKEEIDLLNPKAGN